MRKIDEDIANWQAQVDYWSTKVTPTQYFQKEYTPSKLHFTVGLPRQKLEENIMNTLEQPQSAEATAENAIITIATHDGVFHADDVFAVAVVLMVVGPRYDPFTGEERVRIVRTRDRKTINAADIVIDVGGVYDKKTDRFDHHQGAGERLNGIPYAAFGLVWAKFGEAAVCNTIMSPLATDAMFGESRGLISDVVEYVEGSLVQVTDANDTGHSAAGPGSLSMAIRAFNPRWDEPQTQQHFDRKFDDAVSFAQGVLARAIRFAASDSTAKAEVDAAIAATLEDRDTDGLRPELLLLERHAPWQERVTTHAEGSHIKFVVYPAVDGGWRAQTVQVYLGRFRPVRCVFPREWWGLGDEELSEVTGIPGCTFCHINGFVLGHATKEGAVALTSLALHMDRGPAACRSI